MSKIHVCGFNCICHVRVPASSTTGVAAPDQVSIHPPRSPDHTQVPDQLSIHPPRSPDHPQVPDQVPIHPPRALAGENVSQYVIMCAGTGEAAADSRPGFLAPSKGPGWLKVPRPPTRVCGCRRGRSLVSRSCVPTPFTGPEWRNSVLDDLKRYMVVAGAGNDGR